MVCGPLSVHLLRRGVRISSAVRRLAGTRPTVRNRPGRFRGLRAARRDGQRSLQPGIFTGIHCCDLCLYEGDSAGVKNVFIPGDGVVFVCPELIAHYMNAHWYRPPDEFCRAVLSCPAMRSVLYLKALLANGVRPLVQELTSRRTGRCT